MAIKLLGHVWRNTATTVERRRRGNEHVVEAREPSRWNPALLGDAIATPPSAEAPAGEPVWAETEPWCHD